jgi:hypothetical protein
MWRIRLRTSCGRDLVERVAGRPVSERRSSLSWALVLRVEVADDVDLVRWRVAKGDDVLRRVRGLDVLGMVGMEVLESVCLRL